MALESHLLRSRTLTGLRRAMIAAVAFALVGASSPVCATATPEDTVRTTADQALVILGDKALTKAQRTAKLTTLMDGVSDFETTSKLVLARAWKDFSADQQKEFQQLLRDYLIARYRDRVDDYAGQTVDVTGGREEARGDYTVHTRIKSPKTAEPILVDYRLRKDAAGTWRVIDIIGEGLSIVSNLRSQFQSLLSRGGPDKLIQTLRDKIATGEAAKDGEKDKL
jgi:phospholipid transport system substrate-binding protein